MDYITALDRLYALSSKGIELGLDRVRDVAAMIGDPQLSLSCIQVAGTNGKGSVSSMVAHLARTAGLRVGLYTSPHLHRFAERTRIDGQEAGSDVLARHMGHLLDLLDRQPELQLTFFEVATLTAFSVFADEGVDLAVLEVGMGGRLDATSIARPRATAITSIGIDHTEYLGDTLPEIAWEKAAIARADVPMVVGRLPVAALEVVQDRAGKVGAPLHELGRDFHIPPDLDLPWPGEHQRQNAAVALKLIELVGESDPRFEQHAPQDALATAVWPGRFEVLAGSPRYILDGAHNLEATRALVQSLIERGEHPALMIFGALLGKPIDEMLGALRPHVGRVVLVKPPIARAFDPTDHAGSQDQTALSVEQGLVMIKGLVQADATVLVTGSLFTVAEARRLLLNEPSDVPIGL